MKLLKFCCALLVLLTSNLFAQVTPVEIDSITAGRAFARNLWDRYSFYGSFSVDNEWDSLKEFNGSMDLNGRVTYLEINGIVIVGKDDTPLPGLPYVAKGTITNFFLSIDAMNDEKQVAWGYSYLDRLLEGQPVLITLYPENERGFVEYDDESTSAEHPRLVDDSGADVGWYDINYGGFFYYIDPLNGPITAYVVIGNRRVASFWLDPFSPAETLKNNLINIELIGGVSRVLMNEYGYSNYSVTTDGQTEFDGRMIPAKVFLLDTEGVSHQLFLQIENGLNIAASVYDVSKKRFDLIQEVGFYDTGHKGVHHGEYQIPKGYGKVLIVVTSINEEQQPFQAFFSKSPGIKGVVSQ